MTPQSTFMVLAPIADGQEANLRSLLDSMNLRPGVLNPQNGLVRFGQFERLHFARFVVLEAPTAKDVIVYDIPPAKWTTSLVFLGDCDGPAERFLADLIEREGAGLRQIFAHCRDFSPGSDLFEWMRRHEKPSAANYFNWIGRTVVQIREEQALHRALVEYRQNGAATAPEGETPLELRNRLVRFVEAEQKAGRLQLTPEAPTPFDWRVRNTVRKYGVPLALLALAPLLLVASPVLVFQLRSREKTDPEIAPRPDRGHVAHLEELEDYDITNPFNNFGDLKPGRFRLWTTVFLLWLLNYSTHHIFNRGYLTRVRTIHSARWVFMDDRKRAFFASNYDGSVESYMDDFINRVAWGINLVFSNFVGYPQTDWLIKRGASNEQVYKRLLRRHQQPTAVWYNAYPGLSAVDLERNTRIREGIERRTVTEREAREWLRLL